MDQDQRSRAANAIQRGIQYDMRSHIKELASPVDSSHRYSISHKNDVWRRNRFQSLIGVDQSGFPSVSNQSLGRSRKVANELPVRLPIDRINYITVYDFAGFMPSQVVAQHLACQQLVELLDPLDQIDDRQLDALYKQENGIIYRVIAVKGVSMFLFRQNPMHMFSYVDDDLDPPLRVFKFPLVFKSVIHNSRYVPPLEEQGLADQNARSAMRDTATFPSKRFIKTRVPSSRPQMDSRSRIR